MTRPILRAMVAVVLSLLPAGASAREQSAPSPGAASMSPADALSPNWQVSPAWSPDGSRFVTVSKRNGQVDLWITDADTGAATQWTNDSAAESQPAWSPNGQCIAFVTTGNSSGIDVKCADGPAHRVIANASRPQWSPDGKRILCVGEKSGLSGLLAVPAEGGAEASVVLPWLAIALPYAISTTWRPDGVHLAAAGFTRDGQFGLWVVPLDAHPPLGKPVLNLREALTGIAYRGVHSVALSAAGDAFYIATTNKGQGSIWRIPLDPKTLAPKGRAQQIAQAPADRISFDVTASGRVAAAWELTPTRVWLFPFHPETGEIDVEKGQPVGAERGVSVSPDFTPAGDRLAYTTVMPDAGSQELHVRYADGTDRVVAADRDERFGPRWSPDGSKLTYRWQSADGTKYVARVMDVQSRAERDLTSAFPTSKYTPFWWAASGRAVLASVEYEAPESRTAYAIAELPLQSSDHKARVIAANNKFQLWQSSISRDGRWMALVAQPLDSKWSSLMVMPATGGQWAAVTDQLGWDDKPRWSPDGRMLYFLSRRSGEFEVWSLPFNPQAGTAAGPPRQITHLSDAQRHLFRGTGLLELAISGTQLAVPIEELTSRIGVLPPSSAAKTK